MRFRTDQFKAAMAVGALGTAGGLALLAGCGSDSSSANPVQATMTTGALSTARLQGARVNALDTATFCGSDTTDARCAVSPASFIMGYTKVELVTLASTTSYTGSSTQLVDADFDTTLSQTIYSGSVAEFDVPEASLGAGDMKGTDLSGITEREHDGILVTYAYIRQDLPNGVRDVSDTNAWTQYEICLADTQCSASDALIGDYLVKVAAGFGYLKYAGCSDGAGDQDTACTSYSVEATRFSELTARDPEFARGAVAASGAPVVLASAGATATTYRVFYPFDAKTTIKVDSKVAIAFSTNLGFEWNDGVMKDSNLAGAGGQPNKQGGFNTTDGSAVTDSDSAGTFDPRHDNAFLPRMPQAKITVE